MDNSSKHQIYKVTNRVLHSLKATINTSQGKATLAKLRNSIGKPLSETVEVWPIVFEYLPEDFLVTDAKISAEEQSILTALQLYALHQQGGEVSVLMDSEDGYKNMGYSLKHIRKGDDIKSTDRRFNAMITSSSFEELTHHLRHLINLLKSRSSEAKVNYAKLSEDLYWYLRGNQEGLRLAWSRAYYYNENYKGEENNEK